MSSARISCISNMYPGPANPDYGIFVADMCRELRIRGHAVRESVIRTRRAGALATPLKYGRLGLRALGAEADVIYAHYLFPTGAVAALAGRARRTPWVLTAHGRDVANLERRALRLASRPGIEGAAALIVVSRYLETELARYDFALPPTHVVNMGVDMERFVPRSRAAARRRLGLEGDGPIVLAVGGLSERKNPLTLIDAFARFFATERSARLVLVGDGPLRHEIDEHVARRGVAGAVLRTGTVGHADVPDWMAAADVLAVVSLVEPLGQVALEALACGRPVVATTVGGCAEVVPAAGPGRHCDPRDPDAIAAALAELIGEAPDPHLCRVAAEPYDLPAQAQRVSEILAGAAAA